MEKGVKMALLEVMIVIRIQANNVEEILSDEGDFELLCNISSAKTGSLQTILEAYPKSDEIGKKQHELSGKVDKIFFGSGQTGGYGGYSLLPEQFKDANPRRKEIRGSNQKSDGMPSPSDSLSLAIFCLCMKITESDKDLCKISAQIK
ncbi:hypothetical protein, unlikely [Trypanosoma congolense IL3000]|uniref:Variant surface glycoprotein n=1 Tax=Trypanosoma congolense (strain IL3000) TaxID=1068625 RepID=F9W757_TRYCI|nr:hypothetical protein, unlikely [Trypanosoma congolense IL3000]